MCITTLPHATNSLHRIQTYPWWKPIHWLFHALPSNPPAAIPAQPGDFFFLLDPIITLLAIVGIPRLWERQKVFALWLGIALVFLLIWDTKWPQYILILSAPLCMAAAEGIQMILAWTLNHPTTIFTPTPVHPAQVRKFPSRIFDLRSRGEKGQGE